MKPISYTKFFSSGAAELQIKPGVIGSFFRQLQKEELSIAHWFHLSARMNAKSAQTLHTSSDSFILVGICSCFTLIANLPSQPCQSLSEPTRIG